MAKAKKKPYHERIAEDIIERLKEGTAPWQKPWKPGEFLLAHNAATGRPYHGMNTLVLSMAGYSDPRWVTYKQAQENGWQVRKGEKSTTIQHWRFTEQIEKRDDQGKVVLNKDGKPEKVTVRLERPKVSYASVFNAEQIDGMPERTIEPVKWNPHERAEAILSNSGADIRHDQGNRAYYSPGTDSIHLPDKSLFDTADNYYATALHELGHWTGHPTRLDRDLSHPFGSEGYAKEELRAEIGSFMFNTELGLGHDPGQHTAYVGSWIKALQDDHREIFRAAADAEKISQFVMGLEQTREQSMDSESFKQWFGNSKVTDEKDNPLLVYHGSPIPVTTFKSGSNTWRDTEGKQIPGIYFTDNKSGAEFFALKEDDPRFLKSAYLSIQNPYLVENKNTLMSELGLDDISDARKVLEDRGYDGVIIENGFYASGGPHREIIAFEPDQIKIQEPSQEIGEDMSMAAPEQRQQSKPIEKTYIDVPYKDRREASNMGASWDKNAGLSGSWYVKDPQHPATQRWPAYDPSDQSNVIFLAVPYSERKEASKLGAEWGGNVGSWYAHKDNYNQAIDRWRPNDNTPVQEPALTPQQEFKDTLVQHGFLFGPGEEPQMDGKLHRMKTDGDKGAERSGAYKGFLDGRPAGFFENHRTEVKQNWKSTGTQLNKEQIAALKAEAEAKLAERERRQQATYAHAAKRSQQLWDRLLPATNENGYAKRKGLDLTGMDVKQDKKGRLVVPLRDETGKITSFQRISENGFKSIKKDSKKSGSYHVIDVKKITTDKPGVIFVAEGFSTAATVARATGRPTVAAVDAGNLPAVARKISARYPNSTLVIAGDDDRSKGKDKNKGRSKASEAAEAVNGQAIFPQFPSGTTGSDFNDLQSAQGIDLVRAQINGHLGRIQSQTRTQIQQVRVRDNQQAAGRSR